MGADFIVGLEVQPRGAGLKEVSRETKVLTQATKENAEENRRAKASVTELEQAERRQREETHRSAQESRRAEAATRELEQAERRRRVHLEQMVQSIRANNLALAQARTDHAQYQRQVEAATEAKRRATGVVNSFRAAIVALQVAVAALGLGALIRDSVNVALAFDRANKSLVAAAGGQQAAGREMAFVTAEADRLGLVLSTTSQAYGKLTAASRGTALAGQQTREVFSAVAETGTVLGLTAEEMQGVLKSLQDMLSKGTVQAEELRGQLGDRLPGAFQIAARAMGVTTAELGKMLEGGKVMATDLLPKLAAELRKTFGPGLINAVNSAQANLNRLRNALDQVKRQVGEGFLSGFLSGFSDLKEALSAEELKAAARDLGESIGKAMRTAADIAVALTKHLEAIKAVLTVIVSLKVAAWFVALAGAIGNALIPVLVGATAKVLTFKAALSSLAIAGPLAAIGIALLAVIVLMEKYISTTRLAHAAEMEKIARSQELFSYYQQLRANKVGLTETEAAYALEIRKTMEAERAALVLSLERSKAKLQAARKDAGGVYGIDWAPEMADEVADLEREIKTIDNLLNGLQKEWDRLGKLPVIKLPVDPGPLDKAAKKLADLLTGFQRAAEQAERIRDAQASGGASEVARVTAEIERQNAAYQALHSLEGLSASAKERLTGIIEGLVGRTQDANRATAEGAAETQRSLAFTASAIEAEARLADAKGQTSAASREAAIQAEADAIAREHQKEGDAAYVAGLLHVLRVRRDYLDGIALEIAAVERQIEQAAVLRQKRAELTDAQGQNTAATRRLTIELEAETQARARGIQIGSIGYQLLLAIAASRAQEVSALDQQTAAQRRLNDAQAQQARARAEFTDWTRQREAAEAYGSEIAGILQSYGLLSEATRDLAIHEQALAIQREEGGARTIEQIEAELRSYAAVEETLARVTAAIELQAYIVEPVRQAWVQVGQTLQTALIDQLVEGEVNVEDLAKTILRTMLQAIAEMLKRWILAHKLMQAEAMRTAAVNAAAAQASGGSGTGVSGFVGTAVQQYLGGGAGAGAGASGAGMGTAASLGVVAAIYVALYAGVSAWIKSHKKYVAEVTFQLQQDVGGLVMQTHGDTAATKAITKQVTDAGLAIVDWIKSLGGEVTTAVGTATAQLTIGRKGQGKNTSWYVLLANGVKEMFASQEEAMSFAMVQALRQAEISGLDPIVLAAIKRNTFKTLEDLQKGIADAVKVASFGQPAVVADLRAMTAEMDRLRASMRETIATGAELAAALGRINAQEVLLAQSQRDAITGKQRTAEEEYQLRLKEAEAWNAEREVRLRTIALQILEVKARIENYKATHMVIHGGGAGGGGGSGGGLIGLGMTLLWMAGVTATATEVITGSGDAQLDALEAYLKSLQDLYDALSGMKPINPNEVPKPGRGGGRGGGGQDLKQGRLDLLKEVEGWKLTDVGRQLQDAGGWFDDFRKRLKELGFSAAKQAELLAAARDDLERRRQEVKGNQLTASRDFINAGTAAGGPLLKGLEDNKKTQLALIAANRDLQKQGLLTQREMRDLNKAIHEAGVRQRDAMVTGASNQLLLDLYQLLGDEESAARLRFDLTLAELELRREELRLAMLAANWTKERMDAILGPLGVLIQRVKDAGPGLFTSGGGGSGSGSGSGGVPPGFLGTFVGQERWRDGIKWRWDGSAWVQVGTYGGSGGGSGSNDNNASAAEDLRQRYRDAGKSEYVLALEQITSDFATLRATFGDTAELADLFATAMGRLRTQFLEGVLEFYNALQSGDISGKTVEQRYGAAQAEYSRLLALVRGGDLSQANALAQAGQDLVQLAGQMWGTSTGGFVELRDAILAQLRDLLGLPASPSGSPSSASSPLGSPLGLSSPSGGTGSSAATGQGSTPNGDRLVAATDRVSETVDLSGRVNQRLLGRIADALDKLVRFEEQAASQATPAPPLNYGRSA